MVFAQKVLYSLQELGYGLEHLFFPRLCEGCRKPLLKEEEVVCLGCETFIFQNHFHHTPQNETTLRLAGRIPFRHATSLAYFTDDSLMQRLIHNVKYRGKKNNAVFLGKQLGIVIKELQWELDALVAVPLHKKKEAARGYNQSDYICKGIASVLSVPVLQHAVVRNKFNPSQTNKTREERIANVAGSFEITDPDALSGRHILLVDDVLTTGATVEACAKALLSIPGVSVSVATAGLAV